MYAGNSLLALIPARGGSKGLPNKNFMNCAGKPLIEWTISAALGSTSVDYVLVSTDSDDIAEVSRGAGASVPFLRPAELSGDDSSVLDVMRHAWETCADASGRRFDYIVLLQPTSPLRTSIHIDNAVEYYFTNRLSDADTLASVYTVAQKLGWLLQASDDGGYIRFCFDVNSANPQRQALKSYFLPNGAIFIVKGGSFAEGIYRANTLPFVMESSASIDIDTFDDFKEAEALLLPRVT